MGQIRTVRFAIHYRLAPQEGQPLRGWTPGQWRARRQGQAPAHGKPTPANIQKHCEHYERSTLPGGCNEHLGPTTIASAWVIDQLTGETVGTWSRSV